MLAADICLLTRLAHTRFDVSPHNESSHEPMHLNYYCQGAEDLCQVQIQAATSCSRGLSNMVRAADAQHQ